MPQALIDQIEIQTSRRTIVRTGVRLAYAAPLVGASVKLSTLQALAQDTALSGDTESSLASAARSRPPVAAAGKNQHLVDTDGDGFASVTLDGSGSSESKGMIVSYTWTLEDEWLSSDPIATVDFPVGKHSVYLTVTDDSGESDRDRVWIQVDEAPVQELQPPFAPAELVAVQRRDLVSLTWTRQEDGPDATGFRIYRSLDGGTSWNAISEPSSGKRSARDADVVAGGSYVYAIASFNDAGESAWSDVAWITLEGEVPVVESVANTDETVDTASGDETVDDAPVEEPAAAPQPPTSPDKLKAKQKDAAIELRWRNQADNADGVRLYRSDDGEVSWFVLVELTTDIDHFDDASAVNGAFAYAVCAFNATGESDWSDIARITVEPPVVESQDVSSADDGSSSEQVDVSSEEAPAEQSTTDEAAPDSSESSDSTDG